MDSNHFYCKKKDTGDTETETGGELLVSKIITHRCSIGKARMDLVFLSDDELLLLAVVEFKCGTGDIQNKTTVDHIKQLLSYSIGPLAYSRWGVCRDLGSIVSLLIYPRRLYRLTLHKPKPDDVTRAFGLSLDIETTDDAVTMYAVLKQYLEAYSNAFRTLRKTTDRVNPRDWTPLNFDLDDSAVTRDPSLGFVFRTAPQKIKILMSLQMQKRILSTFINQDPTFDSEQPVIVKYLSSLLDLDFMESYKAVTAILSTIKAHIMAKKGIERTKAEAKTEIERTKAEAEREKAQLRARIAALEAGQGVTVSTSIGSSGASLTYRQGLADAGMQSTVPMSGGSADQVDSEFPGQLSGLPSSDNVVLDCGIVHPYLGTMLIDWMHPLLVMRDMGCSLTEALLDPAFRLSWRSNQELRRRFLVEVGMSALNLVRICNLCHNDIRLSNIAVRDPTSATAASAGMARGVDNLFCLLDFDMSRTSVPTDALNSRMLSGLEFCIVGTLMMYTVAQIALVVYKMDTLTEAGDDEAESGGEGGFDTADLRTFWLKDDANCTSLHSSGKFESWLSSRPPLARDIFPCVPGSRSMLPTSMDWDYFVALLKSAVGTASGAAP